MRRRQSSPDEAESAARPLPKPLPKPINALYVFLGGAAVVLSNISAIVTHVDEIREFVTKYLGLSGLFRAHEMAMATTTVGAMLGYGLLLFWVFQSFIRMRRTREVAGFLIIGALGLPIVGFLGVQASQPIPGRSRVEGRRPGAREPPDPLRRPAR